VQLAVGDVDETRERVRPQCSMMCEAATSSTSSCPQKVNMTTPAAMLGPCDAVRMTPHTTIWRSLGFRAGNIHACPGSTTPRSRRASRVYDPRRMAFRGTKDIGVEQGKAATLEEERQ
jgi:hypothetical protein